MQESDKPTEVPTPKPKVSWRRRLMNALYLAALEKWPEVKPLIAEGKDWFREEADGMKRGWQLFLIAATPIVLFLSFASYQLAGKSFNAKLEATNSVFVASNSFLLGKLTEKQDVNANLEKQLTQVQFTFQEFKQDVYETNRNKDAQLARTSAERDNALARVSQLESLPATALTMFNSTTNLLQSMNVSTSSLTLKINGAIVTNGIAIILKQTRVMRIQIVNGSEFAAERVSLDFSSPLVLTETNLNPHGEWQCQPLGATLDGGITKAGNVWHFPERELASLSTHHVASLEVSTNFLLPVIVCQFQLREAKRRLQTFNVILALGD